MITNKDIDFVVKIVTYSLILVFKLRNRRITARKMQIFLSGCHFLRQFRQFIVKQKVEKVVPIPVELICSVLHQHGFSTSDIDLGNVLICSSDLFGPSDSLGQWHLVQTGEEVYRWVRVYPLSIKGMSSKCLGSPQLCHNLFGANIKAPTHLFTETHGIMSFGSSAQVAIINTPDADKLDIESKLKEFFSSPKYVQQGDVIQVDEQLFITVQAVEGPKTSKKNFGFLLQDRKSSLYQTASVNALKIPVSRKLRRNWPADSELPRLDSWNAIMNCTISVEPAGLSVVCKTFRRLSEPFLHNQQLPDHLGPPSFLITGPSGSGKRTVVRCVADRMGLHFVQASCLSLLGESSKATELRIRALFQSAGQAAPSVLYLTDIDVVGKSREGTSPDTRIQRFFASEIRQTRSLPRPVLVVASCREEGKCSPDVASALLHKLPVSAELEKSSSRAEAIRWILDDCGLSCTGDQQTPEALARRMPGFRFGDLSAVVTIAAKHSKSPAIPPESMDRAINTVREWQSRSRNAPTIPEVRWEDVGGLEHVIKELLDTIQLPLKYPELAQSGLKRSGILLYGPPGTGKTLLAKAVATECSLHFMSVKGPELLNMYVGQSEENVRNVFQAAREASPCLVFFDELDSLAPNRGRSGDSGGVMDRVVSQLLAELDGINQSAVVFVIGATNRPDLIDPALLRPGRFDKLLFLGVNDSKENQLAILKALTRKFQLDPELDLKGVVGQLPECLTGADLYALCSNAALKSVERNIRVIQDGGTVECNDDGVSMLLTASDFAEAAAQLVPSVSAQDLLSYREIERRINESSTATRQ